MATPPGQEGHCRKALQKKKHKKKKKTRICLLVTIHVILVILAVEESLHRQIGRQIDRYHHLPGWPGAEGVEPEVLRPHLILQEVDHPQE